MIMEYIFYHYTNNMCVLEHLDIWVKMMQQKVLRHFVQDSHDIFPLNF